MPLNYILTSVRYYFTFQTAEPKVTIKRFCVNYPVCNTAGSQIDTEGLMKYNITAHRKCPL